MPKTNNPVTELYYDAVKAYTKAVKQKGYDFDQPSEVLSEMTKKRVYLYNGNGLLATYNIQTGKVKLA